MNQKNWQILQDYPASCIAWSSQCGSRPRLGTLRRGGNIQDLVGKETTLQMAVDNERNRDPYLDTHMSFPVWMDINHSTTISHHNLMNELIKITDHRTRWWLWMILGTSQGNARCCLSALPSRLLQVVIAIHPTKRCDGRRMWTTLAMGKNMGRNVATLSRNNKQSAGRECNTEPVSPSLAQKRKNHDKSTLPSVQNSQVSGKERPWIQVE